MKAQPSRTLQVLQRFNQAFQQHDGSLLEDLIGAPVYGYRAPEWSLRDPSNPRLRLVAEAGFRYDSSLVRSLWAGSKANPSRPVELRWAGGERLFELPPMTWAGPARLPSGGWCGRLAATRWHPLPTPHPSASALPPGLAPGRTLLDAEGCKNPAAALSKTLDERLAKEQSK